MMLDKIIKFINIYNHSFKEFTLNNNMFIYENTEKIFSDSLIKIIINSNFIIYNISDVNIYINNINFVIKLMNMILLNKNLMLNTLLKNNID